MQCLQTGQLYTGEVWLSGAQCAFGCACSAAVQCSEPAACLGLLPFFVVIVLGDLIALVSLQKCSNRMIST